MALTHWRLSIVVRGFLCAAVVSLHVWCLIVEDHCSVDGQVLGLLHLQVWHANRLVLFTDSVVYLIPVLATALLAVAARILVVSFVLLGTRLHIVLLFLLLNNLVCFFLLNGLNWNLLDLVLHIREPAPEFIRAS